MRDGSATRTARTSGDHYAATTVARPQAAPEESRLATCPQGEGNWFGWNDGSLLDIF